MNSFIMNHIQVIIGVATIILLIFIAVIIRMEIRNPNRNQLHEFNLLQHEFQTMLLEIVAYHKRYDSLENDDNVAVIHSINEEGDAIIIRYDKSFKARLHRASDEILTYYSAVKNEILSYENTQMTMSWQHERISVNQTTVGYLKIRGKTLVLYLKLVVSDMQESRYSFVDASAIYKYHTTPIRYRLSGPRRLEYALELIQKMLQTEPIKKQNEIKSYREIFDKQTIKVLIEHKLIKEKVILESKISKIAKRIYEHNSKLSEIDEVKANMLMSDLEAKHVLNRVHDMVDKSEKVN